MMMMMMMSRVEPNIVMSVHGCCYQFNYSNNNNSMEHQTHQPIRRNVSRNGDQNLPQIKPPRCLFVYLSNLPWAANLEASNLTESTRIGHHYHQRRRRCHLYPLYLHYIRQLSLLGRRRRRHCTCTCSRTTKLLFSRLIFVVVILLIRITMAVVVRVMAGIVVVAADVVVVVVTGPATREPPTAVTIVERTSGPN